MESKSTWKKYDADERSLVNAYAKEYMEFLNAGKTERECACGAGGGKYPSGTPPLSGRAFSDTVPEAYQ